MFVIAWKNIWRNKRRTIITAASVFFAVFFVIIMRGFQLGVWVNLVDGVLHSYSGYIQVHSKGYWDNRSFDYTITSKEINSWDIKNNKLIVGLIPRLESFALVSSGEKTKGSIAIGIEPNAEKGFMQLDKKMVGGRYFNDNDSGILVSQGLAKYLGVSTGDSLIMLSQGYQGVSATSLFKIIGIVKLPSPEFDNQMVFMPLKLAQEYYSAPDRLTSVVVDIENARKLDEALSFLNSKIDHSQYEVMSWREMMIELYQQFMGKEAGAILLQFLLYIIVGFGVFGTVLMMISERRHEFAIMIALGMKRYRLMRYFGTELVYICSIGLFAGIAASLPLLVYFHFHPIAVTGDLAKSYISFGLEPYIPIAWQTDYIIQQAINVVIIVILALLYPMYSILKLNLPTSLRR